MSAADLPPELRPREAGQEDSTEKAPRHPDSYTPYVGDFLRHTTPIPKRQEVKWDMRNLIAQRLRAEAGADMTHGAAVAERVRLNQHLVGRNVARIKRLRVAMASVNTGLDKSVATSASAASAAKDASKKVAMVKKAAKSIYGQALRDARQTVLERLGTQLEAEVQEEAKAYAWRMGWARPKDYHVMLANRAAVPYLRGVAESTQRLAQYHAYANDKLDEAQELQKQAAAEVPHMLAARSQGDLLSAETHAENIEHLTGRSDSLERLAKQYQDTAPKIGDAIPQWQQAAAAASAYASAQHQAVMAANSGEVTLPEGCCAPACCGDCC